MAKKAAQRQGPIRRTGSVKAPIPKPPRPAPAPGHLYKNSPAFMALVAAQNAGSGTPNQGTAPGGGTTRKPVEPFLLPEEQQQYNDRQFNAANEKVTLDYNLKKSEADSIYEIGNVQRGAEKQAAQSIDNMIGRGLFQSSIKDGDIADITATSALRQDYIKSALSSLKLYTDGRVNAIDQDLKKQEVTWNDMRVRNAQSVPPGEDEAAPGPAAPAAGSTAPKPPPAPAPPGKTVQDAMTAWAERQAATRGLGPNPAPNPTTSAPQSGYLRMGDFDPRSNRSTGLAIPKAPKVPGVKKPTKPKVVKP